MGLALPFLLAYLLDLLLGDPPAGLIRGGFSGSIIKYWESVLYKARVGAGAWLAGSDGHHPRHHCRGAGSGVAAAMGRGRSAPSFLYTGLATRSLHLESLKVEAALAKVDHGPGRAFMIVGRETSHLSLEDMRRAEIETVAENLADGVVAPMFFTLMLGTARLFFYKAANTMDSMVGHEKLLVCPVRKVAARADESSTSSRHVSRPSS